MACVFGTSLCWAAPTDAEKETARSLMDDGDRLRAANDLAGALQRYQAAHEIMKVPTTGIEVAKTFAQLGKLVEARRAAIETANLPVVEGEPDVMAQARQEASTLAASLATRIPAAVIQVWPQDAPANVFVDGVQLPAAARGLPYKTNPGEHTVQVTATGYQAAQQTFQLDEGAQTTVSVNLVAEPVAPTAPAPVTQPALASPAPAPSAPEPARSNTNAYVAFGIAGAGAVVGTVTGLLSLNKASSAKDKCNSDNECPPEAKDDIDSAKSMATFSNIGFGVAIAAGAWGLYEVLSQPDTGSPTTAHRADDTASPRLSVAVIPGHAEAVLRGSF